jgi:hypothetical protein
MLEGDDDEGAVNDVGVVRHTALKPRFVQRERTKKGTSPQVPTLPFDLFV